MVGTQVYWNKIYRNYKTSSTANQGILTCAHHYMLAMVSAKLISSFIFNYGFVDFITDFQYITLALVYADEEEISPFFRNNLSVELRGTM